MAARAAKIEVVKTTDHGWFAAHWRPALAAILVCISIVYLGDPRYPLTISGGTVEGQPIRAGQPVHVDWVQDWRRLCKATTVRTITLPNRHVDTYAPAPVIPPEKVGTIPAVGMAVLSPIATDGTATYQATVHFPMQFSRRCVILLPSSFQTPEISFKVVATK